MGRIADAALKELANGPCVAADLGQRLRRDGITAARDPGIAVRRALRHDPRAIEVEDGLFASRAHLLDGLVLTRRVTAAEIAQGEMDIDADLEPIASLGIGRTLPLPPHCVEGGLVAVHVCDAIQRVLRVARVDDLQPRPYDEHAIVCEIRAALRAAAERGHRMCVARVARAVLAVLARDRRRFRMPGRPLGEVIADAGLRVHLGWVADGAVNWDPLTAVEAELMRVDVDDLLAREHAAAAAEVQERLVRLVEAHLPERAPAARRRWARVLDHAGRSAEVPGVLAPLAHEGDPDDWYAIAIAMLAHGDERAARRAIQNGLARTMHPRHAVTRACLADLAGQLDGEAALVRLAQRTPGPEGWMADPDALARSVLALGRAHLVESVIEEIVDLMREDAVMRLLVRLGDVGTAACHDLLVACAGVIEGAPGALAAALAGTHPAATRCAAVLGACPVVAAWATAPDDAPDQQQLILALPRDAGRVAAVVALVDYDALGGALKDAFVLPDMVPARLDREVLTPMADCGLTPLPMVVRDACETVRAGLAASLAMGVQMPSTMHQPVVARLRRALGDDSVFSARIAGESLEMG